ncbi:hypothetical protein LEP1GSC096_0155 [Leptospira interrogans serovar Hebdomadis str. R499]|nr:hypothetical protein LEP1GSC096_0155 [Leptospira interrogans serovar Hebdomadis str. R499]
MTFRFVPVSPDLIVFLHKIYPAKREMVALVSIEIFIRFLPGVDYH